jgi:tetratricopeptide (TPR) repeat protein
LAARAHPADTEIMRRYIACLIVAVTTAGSPTARADQTDPRLDGLFTQLRQANSTEAARPIESDIWEIWLQSGDPAADTLMADGIAAMNAGDAEQAMAAFDRLVALKPNFAEAWNKRATALYLLGRFPESIKDIDRVLALEPRHFGALSGLGLCDLQLDRDKAALDAFERAAAVDPNLPGVRSRIEALRKQLEGEPI